MNDENKNEPQDKAVDAEVAREMEGVPEHLRDDGDAGEGDVVDAEFEEVKDDKNQ